MLTIFGKPHRNGGFCDGVSRRDFLTVGGALVGGALALPNLLAAEAQSGKSSIAQGDHQRLPARRPAASGHVGPQTRCPGRIRGEFKPIKTNVPGIEICEHFPRIAAMMDKFVVDPLSRRVAAATTTPSSA